MKHWIAALAGAAAMALTSAHAAPVPGEAAPDFRVTDVAGKPVSLADFKGRYVVLEWNNPSCPFVMKHYDSGNMQSLQNRFGSDQVAWLAINSTAASHPEYLAPAKLAAWFAEQRAAPTAILMDSNGAVAQSYGAKVTPHMYVIDPQGKLIYAGAIDDKRSTNIADVKTAKNHVVAALAQARAGKPVAVASNSAYGCTIKF